MAQKEKLLAAVTTMTQSNKIINAVSTVKGVIQNVGTNAMFNIKDKIINTENEVVSKQPKLKEVNFKAHIAIDFGTDTCGIYKIYIHKIQIYPSIISISYHII